MHVGCARRDAEPARRRERRCDVASTCDALAGSPSERARRVTVDRRVARDRDVADETARLRRSTAARRSIRRRSRCASARASRSFGSPGTNDRIGPPRVASSRDPPNEGFADFRRRACLLLTQSRPMLDITQYLERLQVHSRFQPRAVRAHARASTGVEVKQPAGGLVTALDPTMRRTHGTWVAWGSGTADREVADETGPRRRSARRRVVHAAPRLARRRRRQRLLPRLRQPRALAALPHAHPALRVSHGVLGALPRP